MFSGCEPVINIGEGVRETCTKFWFYETFSSVICCFITLSQCWHFITLISYLIDLSHSVKIKILDPFLAFKSIFDNAPHATVHIFLHGVCVWNFISCLTWLPVNQRGLKFMARATTSITLSTCPWGVNKTKANTKKKKKRRDVILENISVPLSIYVVSSTLMSVSGGLL